MKSVGGANAGVLGTDFGGQQRDIAVDVDDLGLVVHGEKASEVGNILFLTELVDFDKELFEDQDGDKDLRGDFLEVGEKISGGRGEVGSRGW